MNKKVLTLLAGTLLASPSVFADTFKNVASADLENQYFRVVVNEGSSITDKSEWLDVNSDTMYSLDEDESTLWTVKKITEKVNGADQVLGYQLISVLTNEPLSVKVGDVTYNTFNGDDVALWFTKTAGFYGKTDKVTNVANGEDGVWRYDLKAVAPSALTKAELDDKNGDSFSIQIGYQETKDGKLVWNEYTTFEGGNVFAGKLYVGEENTLGTATQYALYTDAARTKRIVLTTDKWEVTSSQLGSGYKFDVLTDAEYDAEVDKGADSKILADQFIISAPATVQGDPIEVVAVNKKQNASYGTNNFELVVSVVKNAAGQNVNRLTVADALTSNTADYTKADGGNTYVKFGQSNAVNTQDFIGKLWNIYKNGRILSPAVSTSATWLATTEVYAKGTEGLWMWNEADKKFYNRESGVSFAPTNWRYTDTEYTYTVGEDVYTIVAQGTPAPEGTTDGYLSYLSDDQLKQKAFYIGTPRVTNNTTDTVYIAKGQNGVLGFTTDKTEAVEFRLERKAFDKDSKFFDAQLRGDYSAWKTNSTTEYENKTDIVKLYQYTIADAITGESLSYDQTNGYYILSDASDVTPYVFKEKGDNLYNILLNVTAAASSDNKYYEVKETVFGPKSSSAQKLYGAHNANHLVRADKVYEKVQNDLFVVVDADAQQYRGDFSNAGVLDTVKIFRNDDPSYVLYEKGTLLADAKGEAIEGFLGMENVLDPQYATKQPAMLADTAKHANTYRPQYMFAVDTKVVPAGKICPICGEEDCAHAVATRGYLEGRYLVTLADSANAAKEAGVKDAANKFKHEGFYRLGFVQAKHMGDSLIIASGTAAKDTIDLVKGYDLPCTFALKYVDGNRDAFTIETMLDKAYNQYGEYTPANNSRGYIKYQNGVPVVTSEAKEAWVFDLEVLSGEENAPTANEEIATSSVVVAGVNGAVVVKGAEGKNVIVSTILGKVVANEVVSSDNATIAAPQGVVVVSVDGESFKVVVK